MKLHREGAGRFAALDAVGHAGAGHANCEISGQSPWEMARYLSGL